MDKAITIQLPQGELCRILDALGERAKVWSNTAAYLDGDDTCESLMVEECSHASQARGIGDSYRSIMASIAKQSGIALGEDERPTPQ